MIPVAEDRPDGLEVLAFHRGKWRHVRWSVESRGWSLGYGGPFIHDVDRAFAPLPPKPESQENTFYDWAD